MTGPRPLLYVGTYAEAGGAGIVPLCSAEPWRFGEPFAAAPNCSFAAWNRARGLAYLVDERPGGLLRVVRLGADGWRSLGEWPTLGDAPCYVALDRDGAQLAVANYGSGSAALFALGPDGLPTGAPRVWQGTGSGPDRDRQEGPHVHSTMFDRDGRLYAVDLGSDRIVCFAPGVDPLAPTLALAAPPGSGPRHLVFHPVLPVAYLVSELAATVTVLDHDGARLVPRATIQTAPPDFAGDNLGGHLSLNAAATRLHATNRGHDSIATFAIDPHGDLALIGHAPTHGASPRSFALLESQGVCVVANEEGETVAVLGIRDDGGLGEARAVLPLPGAAFPFAADP